MNERKIDTVATEDLWRERGVPNGYYDNLRGKTTKEILGIAWTVAAFLEESFDGVIVWNGSEEQDDMS